MKHEITLNASDSVVVTSRQKELPRLNDTWWLMLARAESALYTDGYSHAYTSVMTNDGDDVLLMSMWDQAWLAAENSIDDGHRLRDPVNVARETAHRVARALAVLSFGTDFLLK